MERGVVEVPFAVVVRPERAREVVVERAAGRYDRIHVALVDERREDPAGARSDDIGREREEDGHLRVGEHPRQQVDPLGHALRAEPSALLEAAGERVERRSVVDP